MERERKITPGDIAVKEGHRIEAAAEGRLGRMLPPG